jgi:hypothetical protein
MQEERTDIESASASALRRQLAGAPGCAPHGAMFPTPAIAALVHFGSIFWFVSVASVGLAPSSLCHGRAMLRLR